MTRRHLQTTAFIRRLRQFPSREEIFKILFPIISGQAYIRPHTAAELIHALSEVGLYSQLAELTGMEIRRQKHRFPFETIVGWVEQLSSLQWHHKVWECADRLADNKYPLSLEQIVDWGLTACHDGDYRSGGCLLLLGKYRPQSVHDIWQINDWACSAAHTGNHGATRLYPILLLSLKPQKGGRLSQEKATALANAPANAYTGANDFEKVFLPHFLLQMAHEQLRPGDFSRIVREFQKQTAKHREKLAEKDTELETSVKKLLKKPRA